MKTLSADQLSHYAGMSVRNPVAANRYWARCAGQDGSPIDEEGIEKVKAFLKPRLSAEDHEAVCSMMDGGGEAQGTEPYLSDPDGKPIGKFAGDESFRKQFPDAARIRVDNSGIQPRGRAASYSAADAASFAAMFPDAMKIGLL